MEISHFCCDLLEIEYASPNIYSLDYTVGGLVAKSCPTLANPWTVAHKAPMISKPYNVLLIGLSCVN